MFRCPCFLADFGDNGGAAMRCSISPSAPGLRRLRTLATSGLGRWSVCGALTLGVLLWAAGSEDGFSQSTQNEGNVARAVSGTVTNSVTHEPIGRAVVYSADGRVATFTDDHGHFEVTLPTTAEGADAGGQWNMQGTLLAKKPGFLANTNRPARVDAAQDNISIVLVPEARIVGHVKFPSAEGGDHAQVMLYRREVRDGQGQWQRLTQVVTRADGEFRFSDLREGQYKVFSQEAMEQDPLTAIGNGPVYGFPPRFFAAASDFASADTISIRAGETVTANLAPERQRYYDVKIPVPQAAGSPPGDVSVTVRAQGHRGPGFELGYDPNQNAIRGSLPNGTYTIEANSGAPAAASWTANITVANGAVNAQPLTMTSNGSIEVNVRQDFTGEGAGALPVSVYVSLASADEFTGPQVSGQSVQSQGSGGTQMDVRPGRYWVQVQAQSGGIYPATVTSGTNDLMRTPLVVPFGGSVPPIEITLRNDSGEIDATVDGKPLQYPATGVGGTIGSGVRYGGFEPAGGVTVYSIPTGSSGGLPRQFDQLPNGSYALQQLPPGDYRVVAFDTPQQLEFRNPEAMRAYESMGETVHVKPGEKVHVQLKLVKSE